MNNEKLSGTFPINIDKGTPTLRSRGLWDKNNVYVYDYNFRDMVVTQDDRYFVVKNRYTSVYGEDTMPPNSLYWEESDKIEFIWAGAIKADMIDADSLVVKNLKTNTTPTNIEISSERNDIRITDNDILKILISPTTSVSMDSMIGDTIKGQNISFNGNILMSPNGGRPASCEVFELEMMIDVNNALPSRVIAVEKVTIPKIATADISLFNPPKDCFGISFDLLEIDMNNYFKSRISPIRYEDYIISIPDPSTVPRLKLEVSLTNSSNQTILYQTIYYYASKGYTVDNVLKFDEYFIDDSASHSGSIPAGEYTMKVDSTVVYDIPFMLIFITSKITSNEYSLFGLYDHYAQNQSQNLIEFKSFDPRYYLRIKYKDELIGINNNSFYVFSSDSQYFKLFSNKGVLEERSSYKSSIQRITSDGLDGIHIVKTPESFSLAIDLPVYSHIDMSNSGLELYSKDKLNTELKSKILLNKNSITIDSNNTNIGGLTLNTLVISGADQKITNQSYVVSRRNSSAFGMSLPDYPVAGRQIIVRSYYDAVAYIYTGANKAYIREGSTSYPATQTNGFRKSMYAGSSAIIIYDGIDWNFNYIQP